MKLIRVVRRSLSETGAHGKLDTGCQVYPICMVLWCVWWYGKHNLVWYGMVWYVSRHKHKESFGTFGSVVERLEALWQRLNAFQAFWERMGAFSKPGRLARIIPYGMVWYGMLCI